MYKIKNPNQRDIFDPWEFLTPKRRQLLENGWPGLFREHILPSIPVDKVANFFDATWGRPTKALYAMIGALILQQTLDLTDDETVRQYSLDMQWHFALNLITHVHAEPAHNSDAKALVPAIESAEEKNLKGAIFIYQRAI